MEQAAPRAPQFLKTPDAAARLGLSPRTLEKHRCYGTGPNFHKLGGRVVYTIADLQAWIDEGERRVTTPRVPPSRHGPLRSERRSFAHR